ncbi:OTU deubiquitinase with linear linkage specificity a [Colossoma macropomum]|uniref:OTU deubiquitinase with linear linkage specificity a n=1 Tax=Colossoma macropomum TaxID=42526 RepID=UPI001864E213|nr:OTU deubiquitinase with linear linkage specificity a [Colossoma macropomum]
MAWLKAVPSSDDVFDEDVDEISLQHKEWRYNMEKRAKDGYRDGMDAGKEASLQIGFNLGYREGAIQMKTIGQLKGIVSALRCWCQSQPSRISELPLITELLQRVDQHEQDLVEAMRKAQERPPPSVSEVAGDLEDLGVEQSGDREGSGCCRKDGDSDCCGKDGQTDCRGQDEDQSRSPFRMYSSSFFQTSESLEQLLQSCRELVTEMGLPEELTFHIQQLRYA